MTDRILRAIQLALIEAASTVIAVRIRLRQIERMVRETIEDVS